MAHPASSPRKAHQCAPLRPVRRESAVANALRLVELDARDARAVDWLAQTCDRDTLRTVVSLIERARGAGLLEACLKAEEVVER